MNNLLVRWLMTSLCILMIPHIISGIHVDTFGSALAAAAVLGVLNFLVRPILILLTFPLTVLTLGFFLLIINAITFQWVSHFVDGFQVDSFGSAFTAACIVSVVSWIMNLSFTNKDGRRVVAIRHFRQGPTIDMRKDGNKWGA